MENARVAGSVSRRRADLAAAPPAGASYQNCRKFKLHMCTNRNNLRAYTIVRNRSSGVLPCKPQGCRAEEVVALVSRRIVVSR